ncbi:MAG TPA: hypothetical protein VG937_25115 [Polyangiaceae bacterium]|nr:hypothetical protein [Polyangiaceae bacterium]
MPVTWLPTNPIVDSDEGDSSEEENVYLTGSVLTTTVAADAGATG